MQHRQEGTERGRVAHGPYRARQVKEGPSIDWAARGVTLGVAQARRQCATDHKIQSRSRGCYNGRIPSLLMKPSRLLVRLASGAVTNVDFSDAVRLVEALGFEELRIAGSHHVFARPGIVEQLNLQDRRGQAKPYQLRQLMKLVQRYDLSVEEGE